jgi:glutamine synthetase
MDKDELRKVIEGNGVRYVSLHFIDLPGQVKGRTIPANMLLEILDEGIGFDGSSIPGFVGIEESDMVMKPDTDTFLVLPLYSDRVARVICDVYRPGGKRFEGDPRYICQLAREKAGSAGFTYNTAAELEFYTGRLKNNGEFEPEEAHVREPQRYFDISPGRDATEDFRREFASALASTGKFTIEAYHHEVGSGQHEINFRFADPVTTSDNILTYKFVAKEVAKRHNMIATFMPKPCFGRTGSGMHVHLSLFNLDGSNAFFDKNEYAGLSQTGRYFVGGLLSHARALSAIVAPTVNSYKRLVPGYEAPVYIMWSRRNRSALVRVPEYFPGKEKSVRAEFRCPDPTCNPYLAFAAILEAGLDGVKNKLDPGDPVEKNVYHLTPAERESFGIKTLPESLSEALDELESDNVVKAALGDYACEKFIDIKRREWDEYRLRVTPWELETYLYA